MAQNNYFLLFANCILVIGASRSTICDLQKGFYIFIPNKVANLLLELEKSTIEKVLNNNPKIGSAKLNSYFDYFIRNEIGHFCSIPINFPKMNTTFQRPNKIEDCIIELSNFNYNNITYIVKSLTNLGCVTLELRSYECFPLNKISKIIELLKDSRIRNVEIYIKHSTKIVTDIYSSFLKENQIIGLFVVHSCDKVEVHTTQRLFFTQQKLSSSNCCGKISKENFVLNLPFYLEGIKYNTCLNKKISISVDGSIKNCPSLSKNYGNISNSSLETVVDNSEFKKLWNINKNKINVCKNCEFRVICSDCRAYVQNKYSKPLNCKYNPYTMTYES